MAFRHSTGRFGAFTTKSLTGFESGILGSGDIPGSVVNGASLEFNLPDLCPSQET